MTTLITTQSRYLMNVLLLDAVTCAGMGLMLILAASFVTQLTEIPTMLLSIAGLLLLPIAAFMAFIATRKPIPVPGVMLIVVGNLGWVIASVALMVGPWITPNALGQSFIAAQAVVVLVLAWIELNKLRQTENSGAA